MMAGYVDFEFDLPGALLTKLIDVFDKLKSAPLSVKNIDPVPEAQGIYQLFLDDKLVYIGKTDADAGLKKRLLRHRDKILHRAKLNPKKVSFKAVRIYVFTAIDLEAQLIKHYNAQSLVEWNASGFGSNDPGRNRDKTRYKAGHFDLRHPIDIDRSVDFAMGENSTAAEILNQLKGWLPYTFRFEGAPNSAKKPHPDLQRKIKLEPIFPVTVRAVLKAVVKELPNGWQATKLPSTLILYKETTDYDHGEIIARSPR